MSDQRRPVTPLDLINGSPRVSSELQEERFAICKSCEFLKGKAHKCKKCGCYMELKTRLSLAFCPVGKW